MARSKQKSFTFSQVCNISWKIFVKQQGCYIVKLKNSQIFAKYVKLADVLKLLSTLITSYFENLQKNKNKDLAILSFWFLCKIVTDRTKFKHRFPKRFDFHQFLVLFDSPKAWFKNESSAKECWKICFFKNFIKFSQTQNHQMFDNVSGQVTKCRPSFRCFWSQFSKCRNFHGFARDTSDVKRYLPTICWGWIMANCRRNRQVRIIESIFLSKYRGVCLSRNVRYLRVLVYLYESFKRVFFLKANLAAILIC